MAKESLYDLLPQMWSLDKNDPIKKAWIRHVKVSYIAKTIQVLGLITGASIWRGLEEAGPRTESSAMNGFIVMAISAAALLASYQVDGMALRKALQGSVKEQSAGPEGIGY